MVSGIVVNPQRVRLLSGAKLTKPDVGGVVYWMQRDVRVQDNWAMLHAAELSKAHALPLSVIYCVTPPATDGTATAREWGFRMKGLHEVASELKALGVPFCLLRGEVGAELAPFCARHKVAAVVTDYSPLRRLRADRAALTAAAPGLPVFEVDAHNIVPVWVASDKKEVGARTLRPKITGRLPDWLVEMPRLEPRAASDPAPPAALLEESGAPIEWEALGAPAGVDASVPEVKWCEPGPAAALAALDRFCAGRLKLYAEKRNDPNVEASSDLSCYLNYGHLSAQRLALVVKGLAKSRSDCVASFLEEAIVRRELSDNFCHYEPHYDSFDGAAGWARETLRVHAADKREYVYTRAQLEASQTHDDLWNAAQAQQVRRGKMHGFMRMYWAKKILEWSPSPEEALAWAIYLNDRYALDGRDPNGFVGCAWSVMGTHDMGWTERSVFGKIRYMNYNGCKRKFDVPRFVQVWGGKGKAPGGLVQPTLKAQFARAAAGGSSATAQVEAAAPAKPPAKKKPKLGIPLPP